MEYIIDESKLTNVISKFLNLSFDGFEDMDYTWADFDCGWGVCCDIYAIGFVLPGREHDDYLFKLVDGENYNNYGNYPEELMGELPEPCHDVPDITESRFDTLWLGDELIDRLVDMFGNMNVWDKSFLNIVNQKYGTNATITEITDNGVKVAFKNGTTTMVPIETFMKNAVGAPWLRRGYSVLVPFFIKRLSDVMLSDGSIDYTKLEKLPDLNPDETSQESLSYLEEEVASYEGETGEYNVNDNAKIVQQSLMKLGYPLPRFKDDGKFGPETLGALKKFQQDNGLTSSVGKLDRLTSKKLAELLKSKNIVGSEELQSSLNSM